MQSLFNSGPGPDFMIDPPEIFSLQNPREIFEFESDNS